MNPLQTTLKNVVALATGQAAYRLGLVALEVLLARSIAPEAFGEYAAALGFATMFLVFIDLGVALGLVRVVSRHDPFAPVYFGNSLLLRGAVAIAVIPVMVGLSAWLHPPSRVPMVALLGVFVAVSSLQEVLASVHQGLGEMEWITAFRLGVIAATAAGVGLALVGGAPLLLTVAAFPIAGLLGFALWYSVTSKRLPPRFETASLRPVLSDTVLYGGMYVASVVTFRQGIVVLSLFRSGVEIASFAAAYRLLELASKVPLVVSMALVPEMFRSAREDPARLERLFRVQVRVLGLAVLPLAVGVALFAPEVVRLVYGASYLAAVPVLQVFAFSLPLSFLTGALGDTLTARDLQSRRTRIYLVVLAIGLLSNVLLARALGAVGTAVSFLISQLALFTLLAHALGSGVTSLAPLRRLVLPAGAALVAGALAFLLRGEVSALFLAPAFVVGYTALCFLTGAVRPAEVRELAERLLHKPPGAAA